METARLQDIGMLPEVAPVVMADDNYRELVAPIRDELGVRYFGPSLRWTEDALRIFSENCCDSAYLPYGKTLYRTPQGEIVASSFLAVCSRHRRAGTIKRDRTHRLYRLSLRRQQSCSAR